MKKGCTALGPVYRCDRGMYYYIFTHELFSLMRATAASTCPYIKPCPHLNI